MAPTNRSDKATPSKNFETVDIYLSAFLMACGIALKGTKKDKARIVFIFPDSEQLQRFVCDYFSDGAVPALSFKGRLRELKIFVHSDSSLFKGSR